MRHPDHHSHFRFHPGLAAGLGTLLLLAPAAASAASSDPVTLEEYVISASRSLQDPWITPSSVTRPDLDRLDDLQIESLRGALDREPGLNIIETGATGAQSSIFLRGASAHQTLLIVDGVRMNDRSAAYQNFLGGAGLGGLQRLEVLRGPQSTLYGSSALGGVVRLETAHAAPGTHSSIALHGGSFDTLGASVSTSYGQDDFGTTAFLGRNTTANDRDNNTFKSWNFAGRIEGRLAPHLLIGGTYRADFGNYEEPGSLVFPAPGLVDSKNHLATGYLEYAPNASFTSRLTTGLHRRTYSFASSWGTSTSRNRREIIDLQNTWTSSDALQVVFGANYERSSYTIGSEVSRDTVRAGYLSVLARATDTVTLTAGGRRDDYDSAGGANTWRLGAAWNLLPRTKLRTTFGTGFSAPGSDDRFGVAQWGQLANPSLRPEKSRGWDIGIDQVLFDGSVTASATWFENNFRNLFEWETVDFTTYEGQVVNRSRASTRGLELGVTAMLHRAVYGQLAYTFLEARNETDNVRLIRRPRHSIDADIQFQASRAFQFGAGLHIIANRTDSAGPIEDFTTVRLHGAWTVRENLRLQVRMENVLNERYEEVAGYPALPRGIFGAVEWTY